jgi:hypothetical protein
MPTKQHRKTCTRRQEKQMEEDGGRDVVHVLFILQKNLIMFL